MITTGARGDLTSGEVGRAPGLCINVAREEPTPGLKWPWSLALARATNIINFGFGETEAARRALI